MSYAELYGPAMLVQTQDEADAQMLRLMDHAGKEWQCSTVEAYQTIKSNLGYYSGYYGSETMERVQRLFNCSHPIFGKAS